ncbi:MAG: 1-acyl-sn-glycerol-3-phosphate acyltransferase [Bacteroidales bacterium]|nr:1-acyl-sn-glycerol-3-phosphate acyltransferase [Bacteroidales bacterium]MDT8432232.1 1-acyl-sn-glycerol-3-phosphate acyltransferase [Bacteroidales bacterium]
MDTTTNRPGIPKDRKVIETTDFALASPVFRGKRGRQLAEWIMRQFSIDQVNRVHKQYGNFKGAAFTSRLLDDIGVHYLVGNAERLENLPDEAFITVSNHPYGGLDGIMTIDLIAQLRPDYKFMVNQQLARIKALEDSFIPVTPTGNKRSEITAASIRGIRETIEHLKNGHPLGLFPSGAVSDFSLTELKVRDRRWQKSILHLLHSLKVPILPIRFFDQNSAFFYFLGLLNWRIRLLRLPTEVFNKKGKQPRIAIGNIISPKEQKQFSSPEALGRFLRKSVYEMPLPQTFTVGSRTNPTLLNHPPVATN